MWRSWTIGFLGVWIILVPLLFNPGSTQTLLLVISGILITTLAFSKLISEHKEFLENGMADGAAELPFSEPRAGSEDGADGLDAHRQIGVEKDKSVDIDGNTR